MDKNEGNLPYAYRLDSIVKEAVSCLEIKGSSDPDVKLSLMHKMRGCALRMKTLRENPRQQAEYLASILDSVLQKDVLSKKGYLVRIKREKAYYPHDLTSVNGENISLVRQQIEQNQKIQEKLRARVSPTPPQMRV